MISARNRPRRIMILLIFAVWMLSGCAPLFQTIDEKLHRQRFESDHVAFDEALDRYKQGDYRMACARFEALAKASTSKKIARRAQLGKICCRLVMARTPAEHTSAIDMWYDFREEATQHEAIRDVALLDPLIVHTIPENTSPVVIYKHLTVPETSDSATSAQDRRQDTQPLQAEIDALKKEAAVAEALQRRLDEVVAENRSLREKITALEAIDQDIQKKKEIISEPSE